MITHIIALVFFLLTIFWLIYFYLHDKEKKEPIKLIILGITVSLGVVIVCAFVEEFFHGYIKQAVGISMFDLIHQKHAIRNTSVLFGIFPEVVINAAVEEIGKFL